MQQPQPEQEVKRPAAGSVYEQMVARRLARPIASLCVALGASPNAVSLVALAVGTASFVLVGLGSWPQRCVGVALLHLYEILDCVDGDVARRTRRFSTKGLFLENFSAYTLINGFYLAVAYYLWRTQGLAWAVWVAVALVAFARNTMPVARRTFIEVLMKEVTAPRLASPGGGTSGGSGALGRARRFFDRYLLNSIDLRIVLTTVLLLEGAGLFGARPATAVVFAGYASLHALREGAALARYLLTGALDGELAALRAREP